MNSADAAVLAPGDRSAGSAVVLRADVSPALVAAMLFCTGACALIYQTVWMREFRLVFGASTAASAAVLGVFMGGLGLGGALLGRRVDRSPRPLAMYARLELSIATAAALTPLLAMGARSVYLTFGGSPALGPAGATLLRLVLAALVLLLPTFLMGATLPAAARAITGAADTTRSRLSLLYATNALGAVAGTLLSTFVLLERMGNHATLWIACAVNASVALVALIRSGTAGSLPSGGPTAHGDGDSADWPSGERAVSDDDPPTDRSARLIHVVACVVGLAFLLMELVWYRMLGPLLGGSVFTFGMILAVALAGIGLGSFWYTARARESWVSAPALAFTCALEALCIAVPYALGDRLAMLALAMRPLAAHGFFAQVAGWGALTAIVVLPAAFVSGAQFPLLIALLGRGRQQLGRQAGLAYGWNTFGAIAGSLAGGFGALPLLSATGTWRADILLLCATSGVISVLAMTSGSAPRAGLHRVLPALALSVASLIALGADGPSAVWRHSGIGAGRADWVNGIPDPLRREQMSLWRNQVQWEVDGVESSIALVDAISNAFVVNGKNDGSVRADAATFVMSGMVGALLHPDPRNAFIVGLGTGSSAGWLASVPSMQRVDVVELEPRVRDVAAACAAGTEDALGNPKVRLEFGDARESLLTSTRRYDLVLSQPSNPYRAGVASLFTREFYHAAADRLTTGGLFLQWVQSYEVSPETIGSIYATLISVFPYVETWEPMRGDLLFVAGMQAPNYDVGALRARVAEPAYRRALVNTWRVDSLEGLLAHYGANAAASPVFARLANGVNTDDRTTIEFAFARSVGRELNFDIRPAAREIQDGRASRPPGLDAGIDWTRVERERDAVSMLGDPPREVQDAPDPERAARLQVFADLRQGAGNLAQALERWRAHPWQPVGLIEIEVVAELLAEAGDPAAFDWIERVRAAVPIEADALEARLRWRRHDVAGATDALIRALEGYRRDPWPSTMVMVRAFGIGVEIARRGGNPALGRRLYDALSQPFAVHMWEKIRQEVRLDIARALEDAELERSALHAFEPNVPWREGLLEQRARVYRATGDPLAERAERELHRFFDQ